MRLILQLFTTFILVLLATSCSQQEQMHGPFPLPVEIAEAIQKDVPVYINAIGNVYCWKSVQIRPQIGGVVSEVHWSEGQDVKKGDLLYTIDHRNMQAQLDQANAVLRKDMAALKQAENTVERYKELVKNDYVSKLDFEKYKTEVELLQAQILIDRALVTQAEITLGYCAICSPINGRIGEYNVDAGNLVIANDPNALTEILQIDPAEIRFAISQKDFAKVRHAQQEGTLSFEICQPDCPTEIRNGDIYFYSNRVDMNTGMIQFKGSVANADAFFWPGEFVNVRLKLKVDKDAVLVPEAAIQIGQDGKFVFVLDSETMTTQVRFIEVGETIEELVVIAKGITKGEKVVTNGQINLRPGANVFIAAKNPMTAPKE